MTVFNIYSKQKNGSPENYRYDIIPRKLRNQIAFIWKDFFYQDNLGSVYRKEFYYAIFSALCREHGVKLLHHDVLITTNKDPEYQVEQYFERFQDTNVDNILDVIHVVFTVISKVPKYIKEQIRYDFKFTYTANDAINDLNTRFRENGIGYQYLEDKIVRIDNEILHNATINGTINLINNEEYRNANLEFLKAIDHHRYNRNQECLNECAKSFESIMKIICHKNKWHFSNTDGSRNLISILIKNNFLSSYNESQLNALRQLLEGQIPTIRNKNSAHGQGIEERNVTDSLATMMLYITGATIVFLVQTQNEHQ